MVAILLGSVQTAQVLGGHRSRRARFALLNRPCCESVVETRVNPPGHARCGMGSAGIPSAINTPCNSSSSLRCAAMQPLGDLHCLLYPYRWEVGRTCPAPCLDARKRGTCLFSRRGGRRGHPGWSDDAVLYVGRYFRETARRAFALFWRVQLSSRNLPGGGRYALREDAAADAGFSCRRAPGRRPEQLQW